jgi:hypothetical protein
MKVERTIEIDASPETVYRVVMDPRRLDDWVTIHHALREAPKGELRTGSELTQVLRLAGQRFTVHWTVVENDFCRRVVWEGRGPVRSRARVVYGFEPSGKGTRFSYANEYRLPAGGIGRLAGKTLGRLASREADRSLERLKSLIE